MNPLHNFYKISISNALLFTCIVATLLVSFFPELDLYHNWGMHSLFLDRGNYLHFFGQIFTSQFLHGGVLHLFMNTIFVYYFGNIVELMLGSKKYILFFIFVALLNAIVLYFLAPYSITIGISGFALAILAYYTLELKAQGNPEYQGGITAIVLNLVIGFYPGISLYGHLFGAIAGAIFFILHRKIIGLYIKKWMGKN